MTKDATAIHSRSKSEPEEYRLRKTRPYVMATVSLLLLAFSLRVVKLGAADLTFDEVATYYVANRPIIEMVRYVMGAAREHPPVYYLLMSIWMRLAGVSEFAVRFPSVLIGVLAVSWGYQLGQRLPGRYGSWWSALLCAIMPFGLWAGRTGRMYALVLLLSLVVMVSWLRWLAHPTWRYWLGFVVLSMIAALTHYYLALLWPVQALILILLPRETEAIRKPWLLTLMGVGICVGSFVIVSPGIRAMLLEVASRFPYKGFRSSELGIVFTDLYVWGYRPELLWVGLLGLGLTIIGWVTFVHRERTTGLLIALWGVVPLVIAHMVPERLESRYLTPIFPALVLGLAALLARLRISVLRYVAIGGLLSLVVWRLPVFYSNPDQIFSTRIETLHIAAKPGDALVMNGPWPELLLTYYHPPEYLDVYAVPAVAPPGFSASVDVPRLEEIIAQHDRVWVSYGAIHWADPQYSVSRWLAENTYLVFQRAGMGLYVARADFMDEMRADIEIGTRLRLLQATTDRREARVGDIVRVGLEFEGANLDRNIGVTIGLLDAMGTVWQQGDTYFGPMHQPQEPLLPDRWHEQRGLLLLPGVPPGLYSLAFKAEGEGISSGASANAQGWIPLGALEILPGSVDPTLVLLLPNAVRDGVVFGEALSLVGVQPYADTVMQGYPTGFYVWWRAVKAEYASLMKTRLVGPETWLAGTYPLGPDFYPPAVWQTDDVIRQSVFFQLPDKLPGGTYRVQIQIQTDTGESLALSPASSSDVWHDIFSFDVETRSRRYTPPFVRVRQDVQFGDVLRLSGYRIERKSVSPGTNVHLEVYWQALVAPSQLYAVLNQLRGPDTALVWQGDSWPQAGIYTTNHWDKNEVVAEVYTIAIPDDILPGKYDFYTGVYDPVTGIRLPAVSKQGERLVNDEFILFQLEVLP